ncbi:Endoglucanase 5 [Hordeum vulgare]|nr:Endoglucanase 5 [Hordeum vulgare]
MLCRYRRRHQGAAGDLLRLLQRGVHHAPPDQVRPMLAEKMQTYGATGWLVNTGRSGGRYGVGKRIKLPYTRKIINAIHSGELLTANYHKTELFEFTDKYRGRYDESVQVVKSYYPSASGYKDELLWAGLWLHRATGGREYLDYVVSNADDFDGTGWGVSEFSWDIKYPGLQILASKVDDDDDDDDGNWVRVRSCIVSVRHA